MRVFFGVTKLIAGIFFFLLTIATANYLSAMDEHAEDSFLLSSKPPIYAVASCLYLLYFIYLSYSGMVELRRKEIKWKGVIWMGVALGLTFAIEIYFLSTGYNKFLIPLILLISIRDLVLANRKAKQVQPK